MNTEEKVYANKQSKDKFIRENIANNLGVGYQLEGLRKLAEYNGSKFYRPPYFVEGEVGEQRVVDILSEGNYIYYAIILMLMEELDHYLRHDIAEHISVSVRKGTSSYFEELDKAQEMLDLVVKSLELLTVDLSQ